MNKKCGEMVNLNGKRFGDSNYHCTWSTWSDFFIVSRTNVLLAYYMATFVEVICDVLYCKYEVLNAVSCSLIIK
ncbi:hypothetical protein EGR_10457 [Echinococcus granulosus]|uniref:Uncharacterized protein n=1 Tax=Echinococcus granulosus TaxID=6210 RepID=W6U0P9_ECHGR|nr:hypothetical protein EGR_10455 [Echinococcus granulosus]XP_024345891.1 hypothetical protein EGR_10457 [Echinococcus granulosus]EUB54693.1 hypothetical protein EGR_10455 [Echinococcus granulosus]EUB54695.1 hypothetical protein EGR_10457 [Echinococcus granulosus]